MPIVQNDQAGLLACGEALRRGELVGMPTETVYGLAANAFCAKACESVFIKKQRPPTDPLIVHIADFAQLEKVAVISDDVRPIIQVLKNFWPGPLTMVLPKQPEIPDICTAGQNTVGVRWPSHPAAQALIRAAGVPLAAPSANKFGHVSPVSAQHVDDEFGDILVLDGGQCDVGIESSVVGVSASGLYVYRKGIIAAEDLREMLKQKGVNIPVEQREVSASGVQVSPGCLLTHYAPSGSQCLFAVKAKPAMSQASQGAFEGEFQKMRRFVINAGIESGEELERICAQLGFQGAEIQQIYDNPTKNFFASLRFVESRGAEAIVIIPPMQMFETGVAGPREAAVFDRIFRSCSGRYVLLQTE